MRNRDKHRYQLFLSPALAERLEQLAAKPGVSRSAVLVEALDAWLTRQGGHELDERFGPRLDRMSRQLARIARNGDVLLESLSLFVLHQFCTNARGGEPDAAAKAVGRDRFEAYITEVGRRVGANADSAAATGLATPAISPDKRASAQATVPAAGFDPTTLRLPPDFSFKEGGAR